MSKKAVSNTIKYGLSSIGVFLVLILLLFGDRLYKEQSSVEEYVLIGDSIFGQFQNEASVTVRVEELTGISVCNAALGGTTASHLRGEGQIDYTKDLLCMEALSRAIATNDFGAQQTVRIRENSTEHFDGVIDYLATIDFEQTKILFLCYGINDYHAGTPIGVTRGTEVIGVTEVTSVTPEESMENEKDIMDLGTFTGALRSSLEYLQKAYPQMRIVLITPTYSWYPGLGLTCEEYDLGGGNLEEYVNAELLTAGEYGVECIDIFHDFYSHEQFDDWKLYTSDGVHANERGREMLAQTLVSYLTNNSVIK